MKARNEIPKSPEHNALKAYLESAGCKPAEAAAAAGSAPANRSRAQIAAQIRAWIAQRPRKPVKTAADPAPGMDTKPDLDATVMADPTVGADLRVRPDLHFRPDLRVRPDLSSRPKPSGRPHPHPALPDLPTRPTRRRAKKAPPTP